MSESGLLRLFLDSNVRQAASLPPGAWISSAFPVCRPICRLVLAEIVRQEVEDNLLHRRATSATDTEQVLTDYTTLITLARPEIIPLPDAQEDPGTSSHPARCRCPRLALCDAEPSRLAADA